MNTDTIFNEIVNNNISTSSSDESNDQNITSLPLNVLPNEKITHSEIDNATGERCRCGCLPDMLSLFEMAALRKQRRKEKEEQEKKEKFLANLNKYTLSGGGGAAAAGSGDGEGGDGITVMMNNTTLDNDVSNTPTSTTTSTSTTPTTTVNSIQAIMNSMKR